MFGILWTNTKSITMKADTLLTLFFLVDITYAQ